MRKLLISLIAVLLGSVMAAPTVNAAPSTGDAKKACADIIEGRAVYQSVPDSPAESGAEVLAQMDLGARACKKVNYTMTVLESETDSTVLATAEGVPNRPTDDPNVVPRVEFTAKAPNRGPDSDVCVVITTTTKNGKVLDRAPDTNCVLLLIDDNNPGLSRWR
jgi:hypothetical protein